MIVHGGAVSGISNLRLLKDPIDTTIKVINKIGFHTKSGQPRWTHTQMSQSEWNKLTKQQKIDVIKKMYKAEGNKGGLNNLFAIK